MGNMNNLIISDYPGRIITPDDGGRYFFGYYDLQPYNFDNTLHLCHRVDIPDRCPSENDTAELGFVETDGGRFHRIAATKAWNFQQGAMLQWYDPKRIIYNIRDGEAFRAAVTEIDGGHTEVLPMALATVRPEAEIGLAVNMSRVFDFRPGYGYAGIKDPNCGSDAPEDDGIFLADLKTGESRLLISYAEIKRRFPEPPYTDCKLVVNHITLNESGKRFVFLLRNFQNGEAEWRTRLFESDLEGNFKPLTGFCFLSHYHFKNDGELIIETNFSGRRGIHLFDIEKGGEAEFLDFGEINKFDLHCLYSPDRNYISGDSYQDKDNFRTLYLLDPRTGKNRILIKIYSPMPSVIDVRTDLHARWSPDGKNISFDTNYSGRREIYEIKIPRNVTF